jgi:hypothetical protein
MLKKIALGALLTGLVAVLVWGAMIRTNAVNGQGGSEGGRRGQMTENVATAAQGQGGGGRWNETVQGATGRGGGRWAQGGAVEQTPALPQADVQPAEWFTVEGAIVSVADDLVEVRTAGGEVIPFEGQPLRYALSQGFAPKVGDAVAFSGFDEDGEFKIGQVTSLGSGKTITLRDASGRPGWSGRGRRS